MNKPTPAQAIMMKWLSEGDSYMYADAYAPGKFNRVSGMKDGEYHRNLSCTTFSVLFKNGWVEKGENGRYRLSSLGRGIFLSLAPEDFISIRPELTANDIVILLRDKYYPPEWIFFDELRCGTGYGHTAEQEIDGWAMNTWPSKDLIKISFEIKVYRSDFLKELKNPNKRKFAMTVSNQFFFVTPKGLVSKDELPDSCGLMEAHNGNIRTVKDAEYRKIENPSWRFVASLGRRIAKQDAIVS